MNVENYIKEEALCLKNSRRKVGYRFPKLMENITVMPKKKSS